MEEADRGTPILSISRSCRSAHEHASGRSDSNSFSLIILPKAYNYDDWNEVTIRSKSLFGPNRGKSFGLISFFNCTVTGPRMRTSGALEIVSLEQDCDVPMNITNRLLPANPLD